MKRITLSSIAALVLLAAPRTADAVTISVVAESTPYPGVKVQTIRTTSPTTRAWAAFVDLCQDGVRVDATQAPSSLKTVGTWADGAGARLATNGDFYKTGPVRVYGQAVGGSKPWPAAQTGTDSAYSSEWYYQDYGWIAFGPDWVEFNHSGYVKKHASAWPTTQGWKPTEVTHSIPAGTVSLVSGFPELVVEGKQVTCTSPTADTCFPDRTDMRDRHPRTAMGLTQDRRTFMLVVVDGRTSVSAGMYGAELAELMKKLGAWEAFNLDGGGSTQMWQDGKGYLNDVNGNNSGNGTRAVANHWGVFAPASGASAGKPGHCQDYLVDGTLLPALHEANGFSDFDGDGLADACIRGPSGWSCAAGGATAMGATKTYPMLADDGGWNDLTNAATIRMGDIDGDGKADMCARANNRIECWTSAATPFATAVHGPDLSDASGWSKPQYYSTLRLADFDGDGKDDLCARGAAGFRCYPSDGSSFGDAVQTTLFTDAGGYDAPDKYGTVRMGDVNGDGKTDVCARGASGVTCHLSDGKGFPKQVAGPAWSDASGWTHVQYWSTIRLVDVDGDGKDDLCARNSKDVRCHLSAGDAFGDAVVAPVMADASGWNDSSNYSTLRLADVTGDGKADLCARSNSSFVCWPWTGASFATKSIPGPAMADADGWNQDGWYSTLRMADVTGDGKADLCARNTSGLSCWASDGAGLTTLIKGPKWGGVDWENPAVYGTLFAGGPRCHKGTEVCNGVDDDCDGVVDEGCGQPDAGESDASIPPSDGAAPWDGGGGGSAGGSADAGVLADGSSPDAIGAGASNGFTEDDAEGGCGCRHTGRGTGGWVLLLIGMAAMTVRRAGERRARQGGC